MVQTMFKPCSNAPGFVCTGTSRGSAAGMWWGALWAALLAGTGAGAAARRCQPTVRVKQAVLNDGFHRNITYGIIFLHNDGSSDDWLYNDCIVGLEQSLPPGLFVNSDELRDLQRVGRVNAFPKSKVNVELAAEHASPSFVYVIGKITGFFLNVWVPVHARYHKPESGGGTARNIVPAPNLFLRCPDDRMYECQMKTPPELPFLCNGNKQNCHWKEISYNTSTDEISWDVPVGNMDDFFLVSAGTCLVVVFGSLYLLTAIHRYNLRSKKKQP